jgi:transcriptional regulator with XRE-family HTH domain
MYENRVYSPKRSPTGPLPMPKQRSPQVDGFGARLAALRKEAGYTQQQLADEIGVSRRVVAYYEGETEHPPASLLVDLAQALGRSTDELLGVSPTRKSARTGIISTRWERRVRQIERLDARPKQQIMTFIDAILTAEQARQGAKG